MERGVEGGEEKMAGEWVEAMGSSQKGRSKLEHPLGIWYFHTSLVSPLQ